MCVIGIKCPTTGKVISTGIETDWESFNRLPDVLTNSSCPHCGLTHSWWTREARLFDAMIDQTPTQAA